MQGKLSIKIIILFIFIFLILIGGFIMLKKIRHNKSVIDTDLKEYIPVNVSTVLEINKYKDINILKNYTSILDSVSIEISKNLTYPICIISNSSQSAILGRITSDQESVIKEIIRKHYPSFPPKERKYKDATFLFYPISNNSFFCCLFYKGIFACNYNSSLLEQIIDTESTNSFFKGFSSSQLLSKTSNLYSANLFYNKGDTAIVYNILSNQTNLDLEGFSNLSYNKQNQVHRNDTTASIIDYSIFPNNPIAFSIENKYSLISDSISKYLVLPHYTFFLSKEQNDIVYAVKLSGDRFILYNFLNNLEAKFTGSKFNINDFAYGNQRVYTISNKLSNYIFHSKSNFYLSFYNGYLIYSKNKKSLISYLLNNGKFIVPSEDYQKELDINNKTITHNTVEVFYNQSVNEDLNYSYSFNLIFNKSEIKIQGNIISEKDNDKFNILLNKNQ